MKVSVIVPVFCTEKYLCRALDSLVVQTIKELEVVVVNDGSQGNCDEIINTYANQLNIKYLRFSENRGRMIARLEGMKVAQGEFIGFLDADDYVSKFMYETLYETATANKADIVHCRALKVTNNKIKLWKRGSPMHPLLKGKDIYEKFLQKELVWSLWDKIFRKAVILKAIPEIPIVRQQLNEDMIICSVLLHYAKLYISCNEALYYYVATDGSAVNSVNYLITPDLTRTLSFLISFTKQAENKDFRLYPLYMSLIVDIFTNLHHVEQRHKDMLFTELAQSFGESGIYEMLYGFEKFQTRSMEQMDRKIIRWLKSLID